MTRRCIRCDRTVEASIDTDGTAGPVPAADAVVFTATGNYGSNVFDPDEPGHTLEVVVCDTCLTDPATPVDAWASRTQVYREPAPRP